MSGRQTPTQCKTRECRGPILFVKTEAGKLMPIDWDGPANEARAYVDNGKAGRVQELDTLFPDSTQPTTVRVLGNGEPADPDRPIWLAHFVSCPGAEAHRQK